MQEKTTFVEIQARNSSCNMSVEADLKDYFEILYDLPQKFNEYVHTPTIPSWR